MAAVVAFFTRENPAGIEARFLLFLSRDVSTVEARLLILNPDPVFEDRALAMFDAMPKVETRIVRTLSEAVYILMRENFDLFVVEGESRVAVGQATNIRQHFPSLEVVCLVEQTQDATLREEALQQNIELVATNCSDRQLRSRLRRIVSAFERQSGTPAEGIDPCHSLVGNLNQFSAAEILQMSCMSQRSGRFTFKSRSTARWKAREQWPRSSAGGRAGFILKKELSVRFKPLIGPGPTFCSTICKSSMKPSN